MEKNFRFDLGSRYSFNIYPRLSGWDDYVRNARVVAMTNYKKTIKVYDIHTLQASAVSYLPEGVSKNPEEYTYITFELPSGVERVIPLEWINIATVTDADKESGVVVVTVKAKSEEKNHLRSVLVSNGYDVVSIMEGKN